MTEKGQQYQLELKEKAANSSINKFHQLYNNFHETLRSSKDVEFIQTELNALNNLCHETLSLLTECSQLTTDVERARHINELVDTVQKSFKSAEETTRERMLVIKEAQGDRRSELSSRTSSRSSASSARSAMLKAQARRLALEEKMRYNDAIHDQEKALSKLRLQSEISATRAEEEVYRQEAEEDENKERLDVTRQRSPPPQLFPSDEIPRGNSALGTNEHGLTSRVTEHQPLPVPSPPNETPRGMLALGLDENGETYSRNASGNRSLTFQNPSPADETPRGRSELGFNRVKTTAEKHDLTVKPAQARNVTVGQAPEAPMPTLFKPENNAAFPTPLHSPTHYSQSAESSNQAILESMAKMAQLQRLPQAKPEVFRGDDKDKSRYFLWESAFDALVDTAPVSPHQKLHLLYQHLDGRAKKVVEQLQFMVDQPEIAYAEARRMLKSRFGHPAFLYTDFESKLSNWPKVLNNDARGMQEYSDFLNQVLVASGYLSNLKIFEFPSKIQALVEKLPGWFKTKWSSKVLSLQREKGYDAFPSFADFVEEVTFHSERMNIPQINCNLSATPKATTTYNAISHQRKTVTTFATKAQKPDSPTTQEKQPINQSFCKYHNVKTHSLTDCHKFLELDYQKRRDFVFKNKLCFNCAITDAHMSKDCNKPEPACNVCQGKHLTILHKPQDNSDNSTPPSSNACTKICGSTDVPRSCARIVLVEVAHQSTPRKTLTYAVLDDQSTDVFLTEELLEELDVTGEEMNLQVNTIVGTSTIRTAKVFGLCIQDVNHKHNTIKIPHAYTREDIPANHRDIATPEMAKEWSHLSPIVDQIKYHPHVKIGMLIGRNIPTAFQPISIIYGKENQPWAEEYKFGWTIIGNVCPSKSANGSQTPVSSVHRVTAHEGISLHTNIKSKETSPQQLQQMMQLDYNELTYSRRIEGTDKAESLDDKRFRELMESSIHPNENGNWEAPLPFKTDDVSLPNNRQHCLRRLLSLKRKLQRNEKAKQAYVEFMQKLIDRNHASRVPANELTTQTGKAWYLPHFDVYHPKKPDQVRVVFDCSAVFDDESLNKHLLQGPDLMNALVGVLLRFRKESIAFTCDVEQMFHSFFVNPDDRDFLRFLWFEGNDLDGQIVEYRMNVHLFGAMSSPGVANYCLQETARVGRQEFGDEAADFLLHDFYVDDGLKSVPTVQDACKLIQQSKAMCAAKKLRLHKFASNSKAVLEAIPADDRAKDLKDLDLRHDTLPIQRSLGTFWCIENDTLGFKIELKDKPLTRRGILSTTSSVYDPLGIVAPVILVSKQILQTLCRRGIDWDEPVPDDIAMQWEKWRSELHLLEKVKIDRCLKPAGFGTPVKAEIHSFADACENGLGQVSYLRLVNAHNDVHVSFLMAKSRVAPLKALSIPRMELTAAVISVNVANMLKNELKYEDLQCAYYTDSEIVVGYINNNARRFHVYVGNRVQHIRDHTDPTQWHHVKGSQNPADEASRAMSAKELLDNPRWLKGPEFLWKAEVPVTNHSSSRYNVADDDIEVKVNHHEVQATTLTAKTKEQHPTILQYIERFSSWYKAKSWISTIRRGINSLKKKNPSVATSQEEESPVKGLQAAEQLIIKQVQEQHFKEEIATLKRLQGNTDQFKDRTDARTRNTKLKTTSSLFRLDPFIDQDGLLRVGGRISTTDGPTTVKHPLILPQRSHVTSLIIDHYHSEVVHHQGRGMTLNALRQSGYWIINGRTAVSSYIHTCVTCRKERGKLQTQKMADLPEERVTPAPPFTYSGMDVFGPFHIKEGRKTVKRYGMIFTCLSSRAVHLETLNSMDTDSFVNALRRFLSRRGKVRLLRCDQGTNFVGAKNEFVAATSEFNQDKVKDFLTKNDCELIEFKFNVPHASHMGGVWERMIRSTRSVLSSLLNQLGEQLDDESFRTLMTEAENVINSRPLTVTDLSDPTAAEPLTPNHLLTGKPAVVLPPPGKFDTPDVYCRKRWRRVQYIADQFWTRWKKEYLNHLNNRQKWTVPKRNSQVGDIVLLKDDCPRNKWPLARVTKTLPSKDGIVRKVEVQTAQDGQRRTYERPIHKMILLLSKEEQKNVK